MEKEKLVEAKEKAVKLVEQLRKIQKLIKKKTKRSEELISLAEKFVRCNITNSVIYDKYEEFKEKLEELKNNSEELNACKEVHE